MAALIAVGMWAIATPAGAQQPRPPLVLEPLGVRGEAIFPAFEGWGPDRSGENLLLLLGYYNRNRTQELDIPVGPDNRIEPDGPDYGQPTHFYTGRQHGVFAIKAPKDFGNKKLTWTLTANGQTSTISFWLNPPYWINFFKHPANGNEPPVIKFLRDGPAMTGPAPGIAQTLSATVGKPVPLALWVSDVPMRVTEAEEELAARNRAVNAARAPDAVAIINGQVIGGGARGGGATARTVPPDITVNWRKHRGSGEVTFAQERIPLVTKRDPNLLLEAATTATFVTPGEYVVRAQVNDTSGDGGGGDQCCWTTALVRVNVK
ncbi:MAG: hypothetical protein HYY94_04745 [Gemmatimonadetes bacterium]|nr:hypothetical protein [Gemmatimonadota bacterium]